MKYGDQPRKRVPLSVSRSPKAHDLTPLIRAAFDEREQHIADRTSLGLKPLPVRAKQQSKQAQN